MKIYEQSDLGAMIAQSDRWRRELNEVLAGDSAVIRGLFSADRIQTLKAETFAFRERMGLSGNMAYDETTPDHVKLVDKPITTNRPTRFMLSQFFPWNSPPYEDIRTISRQLMAFRNMCSGLGWGAGFEDVSEYVSWPCIIQYRKGGDFLTAHRDDYAFQTILIMTELGVDFETGGNFYLNDQGHNYLEPELKVGDVLLLKSDLAHGVHAIDPHRADDGSAAGRWMLFCPLSKRAQTLSAAPTMSRAA